jgi:hypothetical protein
VESANIKGLGSLSIQPGSAFLSSWSIFRRWGLSIVLLASLSGCLFLRLSRVLVQMKEPYRFLEVDLESDSFHGTLVEPVVYLKDLETIIGFKAEPKEGCWLFEFKKLGISDREPWSFLVWTTKKGRVQAFELPARVTAILGNPWVMSGIRAVGKAEVSIREKRVFLEVEEGLTSSQVLELLGKPTERSGHVWTYQFGSVQQPMIIQLEVEGEEAKSLLMSSGKLSASFTFRTKGMIDRE